MKIQKSKRFQTSLSASIPSLLSGAATVMNLGGNFYQFNLSAPDQSTFSQDFRAIGQDIRDAFSEK